MKHKAQIEEIHDLIEESMFDTFRSLAGEAAENITGPGKMEKLAVMAMNRLKADIKAKKAKYANINPFIRPLVVTGLELALMSRHIPVEDKADARQFIRKINHLEKEEERRQNGDDYDDE